MRLKWPKWYVFLSIIFVIVFFVYHYKNPSDIRKEKYEKDLNLNFEGLLSEKYLDSENHNYKTIIIEQNSDTIKWILNFDQTNLFINLSIGDSIFKERGSSEIKIIRNHSENNYKLDYGI